MSEQSRREFLRGATFAASSVPLFTLGGCAHAESGRGSAGRRPNVVLIITDDQGYGDLGCHGNEVIQTPNLDRMHDESVRFTQFYVCPVCSPTRSSLMTGRYNYRTGVVDTYIGRSMMFGDEVTVAEALSTHGYRTGIFGKWHLGDNYPMRAMDQGFEESLVHNGGGIGQPSDPPGNSYFDPILKRNGTPEKCAGYCTDIFADAAMRFIETNRDRPFFCYLSTNAPHSPLEVSDAYSGPYLAKGLDEKTAKTYGMITNIDDNLGRLFAKLRELDLDQNTIVIFLTDNGPCGSQGKPRYNAGFRERKGTVYEGGIHVPCFVRWPARLEAGREVDRIAAHIDVFPTLLEACGVPEPPNVQLDGKSLLPLLAGDKADWPDRTLYFQWHRGDEPELYKSCAARSQQYKLVNGEELYDLAADPGEQNDIAAQHADMVARMRAGYDAWFEDVGATRGYAPPRIHLGTPHENPVTLTRQDWRGAEGWADKHLGYWEVRVARAGKYDVTLEFREMQSAGKALFRFNGVDLDQPLEKSASTCTFSGVPLEAGEGRLEAWIASEGKPRGVRYVIVKRL